MSKVQLQGNASGTGIFTIASPNSNTDRTLTLPDSTGTLLNNSSNANFPAGSVIQIASNEIASYSYNSTTSYTLLGSISFTPKVAGSLIVVQVYGRLYINGNSAAVALADIGLSINGGSTIFNDLDCGSNAGSGTVPQTRLPLNYISYFTSASTSPITIGFYTRPHQGNAIYSADQYWGGGDGNRGFIVTEYAQ